MTVQELDTKFSEMIRDMQGEQLGTIMGQVGTSALGMIRRRIQETGINADGTKYKDYSTKPMLSGCKGFLNGGKCPAVSKTKRKELKWVTLDRGGKKVHLFEIPGGYREFRELNGRQVGFVDFTFSGRMWANIKIKSNYTEQNKGVVIIGAITEEDNAKLAGNTSRRGEILKLSRDELRDITDSFDRHITDIVKRNGL